MMKKVLLFLAFGLFLGRSQAQFDMNPLDIVDMLVGEIDSDRPGQALSPTSCGILAIQLQTGFNYESRNSSIINQYSSYYVPTSLRIGLTKKWEINTNFFYKKIAISDTLANSQSNGFLSPEIGIRYAFLQGGRWKPHLALQSNLSILSHKGDFQQQQFGSSFYLASRNQFKKMSLNTNFGIRFAGDSNLEPLFPWVFNLGFKLGDKWSAFVEGFGEFRNLTVNTDAGISYQAFSNLKFDVFGGMLNLENFRNGWFVEGGVSYRFSFLKIVAKKKMGQMGLF
jgi:hypothetical protein